MTDIPILVYCQGSGDHQVTSAARDAVKGTRRVGAGTGYMGWSRDTLL